MAALSEFKVEAEDARRKSPAARLGDDPVAVLILLKIDRPGEVVQHFLENKPTGVIDQGPVNGLARRRGDKHRPANAPGDQSAEQHQQGQTEVWH